MSDTPRTDAKAQFFGFNPDEGEEFVQIDFARELERENALLRADKERMDWLQKNEWYWNSKRRDLRKAIDRARKEIQS
jgi:hypothetical protein